MRTQEEILQAINAINSNNELLYGYREDVTAVLLWCLGGEEFDGLNQ